MQKIVIMIEDGALTGVFTDGDADNVLVDLVDYDNIYADETGELAQAAEEAEEDIRAGKLKSCW